MSCIPTPGVHLVATRLWPTETTLASYSSKGGLQARVSSASVVGGQTPTYRTSNIQLTADTGRPQLWSAAEKLCIVPCTHLVIEVPLLPVLVCGTSCHHICGRTWIIDTSRQHWRDICLGRSQPQCIVTKCFCAPYKLTYLLTYLLTSGSMHTERL